jgi:hypothetical protein
MLSVCLCAVSFGPALHSVPAFGQAPAAAAEPKSDCTGNLNLVRLSDIKPGMMDQFLKAVADQTAWYKKAGLKDRISVMRVMEQDPATKAWKFSATKTITTHIMPAGREAIKHDADWDAFVAEFSASSTIEKSYVACMAATMNKM